MRDRSPAVIRFEVSFRYVGLMHRIVDGNGVSQGSNNHPMKDPALPNRRDGAGNPRLSGPLGKILLDRLPDPLNGIVLDSWLDADGAPKGDASTHMK